MNLSRRSFLRGVSAVLAAPAIVRASNLMPVRSFSYVVTSDYRGLFFSEDAPFQFSGFYSIIPADQLLASDYEAAVARFYAIWHTYPPIDLLQTSSA